MKSSLYFLVSVFLFFSCTESQLDEFPDKKLNDNYFDIADANYIGLKRSEASVSTWSNLYKYLDDKGKMVQEKVGFVDEKGIPIDSSFISIQVNRIIPVTESYVVYTGSFELFTNAGETEYYKSILVRLTDGAFFNLNYIPNYVEMYDFKGYLPADENGNRYFLSGDGIYKLSNLDKGEPVVEGVLNNGQCEISSFFVAPDGTLFFRDYSTNTTKAKESQGKVVSTNLILYNFFKNSAGQIFAFSELGLNEITVNPDGIDTSLVYNDLIIRESELFHQADGNYFFFEEGTKGSDYSVGLLFNEFDKSAFPVIFRDRENDVSRIVDIYENTLWTVNDGAGEVLIRSFKSYNLDEFQVENFLLDADTLIFNTPNGVDTIIQPKTSNAAILEADAEIIIPDNIEVYNYNFLSDGITFSGYDLNEGVRISAIINKVGELTILERSSIISEMEIIERIN